jgi:hypothetical protein
MEYISSTEVKRDGTQLPNAARMRLENYLDQVQKKKKSWESYHIKWTSAQFNVNFHFGNKMFYFIVIYGRAHNGEVKSVYSIFHLRNYSTDLHEMTIVFWD